MESSKLKCILCKKYPTGDIYECSNRHVGCLLCVNDKRGRSCVCCRPFNHRKQNPIEKLEKQTKIPCDFKESGCTWLFEASQLDNHLAECKFRPYRCILDELDVKPCNWTGQQHEVEEHLEKDHRELGTPFSYFQEAVKIAFNAKKSKSFVKLIDAFSKDFLFYYRSCPERHTLCFMIIYFGRRVEAQQYYYELDIRSPTKTGVPRMKFVQQCVADCEDFEQMMEQESNCVAISFKTIKHYLGEGNSLSFRFIVKKAEKDANKAAVAAARERSISDQGNKPSSEIKGTKERRRYTSGSSLEDPPLRAESTNYEYPIF